MTCASRNLASGEMSTYCFSGGAWLLSEPLQFNLIQSDFRISLGVQRDDAVALPRLAMDGTANGALDR